MGSGCGWRGHAVRLSADAELLTTYASLRLTVRVRGNDTVLSGAFADQAALYGVPPA